MIRRYFLVFVLCLLFLASLPVLLLTTTAGLRLTVAQIESFSDLSLDEIDGSLWRGLQAGTARYAVDSQSFDLTGVTMRVDWPCALRRRICINEFSADALVADLPPGGDDETFTVQDLNFPQGRLPWLPAWLASVHIASLQIGHVELRQGASIERIDALSLDVHATRRRATMNVASLRHRLGVLSGAVELRRRGDWEGKLTARQLDLASYAQQLRLPHRLELTAEGDLRSLELSLLGFAETDEPFLKVSGQATYVPQREELSVRANVRGLPELLPTLQDTPWTSLHDALHIEVAARDQGSAIQLRQQLTGYLPAPSWLHIELRENARQWSVTRGYFGDAQQPVLTFAGILGDLPSLTPRLAVNFDGFAPPREALPQITSLSGSARIDLAADDPLRTWSLTTGSLMAETADGEWELEAALEATDQLLLPAGEATLRGGTAELEYQRSAGPDAAAYLVLPKGLTLDTLSLDSLTAEIAPGPRTHVSLDVTGDVTTDINLALWPVENGVEFLLDAAELTYQGQTVALREPLDGRWNHAERQIALAPFCLDWRDNDACAESSTLGQDGDFRAQLRLKENIQRTVDGKPYALRARGSGALELRWEQQTLVQGTLGLSADELIVDPYVGRDTASAVAWDEARLVAEYGHQTGMSVDLQLESRQAGALSFSASERDEVLSGRLQLRGLDLSALDDLSPEWSLLGGIAEADLALSGSRSNPRVSGDFALEDGLLYIPSMDTQISAIRLAVAANDDRYRLNGDAVLGDGPLSVQGYCCEEGVFQLDIQGENNRVILPMGLDAEFSPALDVQLTPSTLTVAGDLLVHRGVLEHSGPRAGGIALSDDIQVVDTPSERPRRFDVNAQIRARIEPGFTVRSEELEATVNGDLRLNADSRQPVQLFGNLEVLGGELRAYGQALRLARGGVGFVGDPANPQLNLSAERYIRAEDLRVGFRVRGDLNQPLFELFSDPVLSEKDTLSYLLRGRGPDAGASMDGTALALSLGASAINRSGMLESLNRIPGLSGVTLGAEGSEDDMAATLSAYVGERLYLSYGVGIYEPVNALTARLYLQSRLWLEVVSRLESSFDLYYRFDRY